MDNPYSVGNKREKMVAKKGHPGKVSCSPHFVIQHFEH